MASPAPVFGLEFFLKAVCVGGPLIFESNNFTVSLTRDFRSPDVALTGPVVGEALTLLGGLAGERLGDSLDSSLFGNEIGLGMRDFVEDEAEEGLRSWTLPEPSEMSLQTQLEQQWVSTAPWLLS